MTGPEAADPPVTGQPACAPRPSVVDVPEGNSDERELLLDWLGYRRGAVLRKLDGLDEEQARWRLDGRLISLVGIINHLTHVEWRWIDGAMRGADQPQ